MRAAVEKRVRRAAAVAHQDQRAAADIAGDEVARLGDLRFMAGIKPAAVENLAPLLLEDLGVGKHPTVDPKDAADAVIDDQVLRLCSVHRLSSRLFAAPVRRTGRRADLRPAL